LQKKREIFSSSKVGVIFNSGLGFQGKYTLIPIWIPLDTKTYLPFLLFKEILKDLDLKVLQHVVFLDHVG